MRYTKTLLLCLVLLLLAQTEIYGQNRGEYKAAGYLYCDLVGGSFMLPSSWEYHYLGGAAGNGPILLGTQVGGHRKLPGTKDKIAEAFPLNLYYILPFSEIQNDEGFTFPVCYLYAKYAKWGWCCIYKDTTYARYFDIGVGLSIGAGLDVRVGYFTGSIDPFGNYAGASSNTIYAGIGLGLNFWEAHGVKYVSSKLIADVSSPVRKLEAGESGAITLHIENKGECKSNAFIPRFTDSFAEVATFFPKTVPALKPGKEITLSVPFTINEKTSTSDYYLSVAGLWCNTLSFHIKEIPKLPPDLLASVKFSDSPAYFPNNILDACEEAELEVTVKNQGKGPGQNVTLNLTCDNPYITVPQSKSLGEIPRGETKSIRIPVKASDRITDGRISILVETKEKRGYDAQPVKLIIPVRHLDKPEFTITSIEINDANIGQARGNGNGIPENDETIEFVTFVKNKGVGKSIDTNLGIVSISSGIDVIQDSDYLGSIEPGKTVKGKVVFHIPRTFSGNVLEYTLKVSEARGVGTCQKSETIPIQRNVPILAYKSSYPEVIHNGSSIQMTLTPQNLGTIAAKNVKLDISSFDNITILNTNRTIGTIAAKGEAPVESFSISIPRSYAKESINLKVTLSQSGFPGTTKEVVLPVKLISPFIQFKHEFADASGDGKITQGEKVDLIIWVSNTGKLTAENVKLTVHAQNPMVKLNEIKNIGIIPSMANAEPVRLSFVVPRGVQPGPSPIEVKITQSDFSPIYETLIPQVYPEAAAVTIVKGEEKMPSVTTPQVPLANQPPIIQVSGVEDTQHVFIPELEISVSVSDDRGISYVQVKLNDVVVYNSQRDPGASRKLTESQERLLSFNVKLKNLTSGNNKVVISAIDLDNEQNVKELNLIYKPAEVVAGIPNPSDVDVNIPESRRKNKNGVALVIGIENYQNISSVTYASRDAVAFKEYLVKAFGYSEENIFLITNSKATLAGIRAEVSRLGKWIEPEKSDVIIFYSGHGAPSIKDKKQYLVPWDGNPDYPEETCYPVKELYRKIGELKARSVTVFMDACFSGKGKENEMIIAQAKPIFITAEVPQLFGSLCILASSEGDQISSTYDNGRHGLFTYYLLKGFRGEADGNNDHKITLNELKAYLDNNVPIYARRMGRDQHPVLMGKDVSRVLVQDIQKPK